VRAPSSADASRRDLRLADLLTEDVRGGIDPEDASSVEVRIVHPQRRAVPVAGDRHDRRGPGALKKVPARLQLPCLRLEMKDGARVL
jgi:hypothetical protein